MKGTATFNNISTTYFTYLVDVTSTFPIFITNTTNQSFLPSASFGIYNVSGYASDPEGGTITMTAKLSDGSPLPAWITFNGTAFSIDTSADNFDTVMLIATDAQGQSVNQTFTIQVINSAPTVIGSLGIVSYYENKTFMHTFDLTTVF